MGFSLSSTSSLFLVLACVFSCLTIHLEASMDGSFKCRSPATCNALVGYVSPNDTTFGALKERFGVPKLTSIFKANNLSVSDSIESQVPANKTVRIPIPCKCSNGTGWSDGVPKYTVVKDDGLFHIAAEVFGGLVKFPKIQEVNRISNPDRIEVGDELQIPLPCSCDEVDGQKVVHYALVVTAGSTVGDIASRFGVEERTLLKLNNITGDKELLADTAFDVPLKAASSSGENHAVRIPQNWSLRIIFAHLGLLCLHLIR